MRSYTYGILEFKSDGIDNENVWQINYADSDDFLELPAFPLSKINLLVAVSAAEELGWELVQIFPDRGTNYISFGYAVVRCETDPR